MAHMAPTSDEEPFEFEDDDEEFGFLETDQGHSAAAGQAAASIEVIPKQPDKQPQVNHLHMTRLHCAGLAPEPPWMLLVSGAGYPHVVQMN